MKIETFFFCRRVEKKLAVTGICCDPTMHWLVGAAQNGKQANGRDLPTLFIKCKLAAVVNLI